jgi:CheY-like chemotaxis protein
MNKEVNILLVEDEEIDIIDMKRMLDTLPIQYSLHVARNGEEAIEILNGNRTLPKEVLPDVLLVDLNMPRMNGFEFLTTITTGHKWGPLAVYVVTTSSDPVDRSAAKALHVRGYIEKPVSVANPNNGEAIESLVEFIKSLR